MDSSSLALRARPPSVRTALSLSTVLALLLACGFSGCASNEAAPRNNGVNDVKRACEIRAGWARFAETVCINCVSAAPAPKCDCESFKDFGGLCQLQDVDRRSEPSCTDAVDKCTRTCARTDCACVESCYAQAAPCKQVVAARDGCVADVCSKYCQ